MFSMFIAFQPMIQKSKKKEFDIYDILTVFPKVNRSWMDIRSSIGVWITGPSIKFIGHSHTPQRRCSDSFWSFGPVMNKLLLDQTNFYWTLPHVQRTLGITVFIKSNFLKYNLAKLINIFDKLSNFRHLVIILHMKNKR